MFGFLKKLIKYKKAEEKNLDDEVHFSTVSIDINTGEIKDMVVDNKKITDLAGSIKAIKVGRTKNGGLQIKNNNEDEEDESNRNEHKRSNYVNNSGNKNTYLRKFKNQREDGRSKFKGQNFKNKSYYNKKGD